MKVSESAITALVVFLLTFSFTIYVREYVKHMIADMHMLIRQEASFRGMNDAELLKKIEELRKRINELEGEDKWASS